MRGVDLGFCFVFFFVGSDACPSGPAAGRARVRVARAAVVLLGAVRAGVTCPVGDRCTRMLPSPGGVAPGGASLI